MSRIPTLDDLDVVGRRILVRVDLNVPVRDGQVSDLTRIDRLLPTLRELSDRGARVALLSHFGRPKGPDPAASLGAVVASLAERLGRPVTFVPTSHGPEAEAAIAQLGPGEIAVLENVRFHPGEEANDPAFAAALARLGDAYVGDAFSAAHRAHASVEALPRLLPSVAGRGMEAELRALDAALGNPRRPVMAVVGGAKISTKLDLLGNLVRQVDVLALGGGMANTFLAAQGIAIGASLAEREMAEVARGIMATAQEAGCGIMLPVDGVAARQFAAHAPSRIARVDALEADEMMLDIGPATAALLTARIDTCRTLVWNGPLGAFELEPFDSGTNEVARHVAQRTQAGQLLSVAGGGDTAAALAKAGVESGFTYLSTAGGAFLEWLEGKTLPGVAALMDRVPG